MREVHLTIENGVVLFHDSNHDILYRINRKELTQTRDSHYSEWIMQLLDKTWINSQILYELARHIQQQFPDNKIDWRKTFFVVEKSKYLDTLGDVMTEKNDSITKSLMTKIAFGQKETNEETHKIIDEIVNRRLNEYGLS